MSNLRNRHITQLYAACLEPTRACVLMEYMEQGTLEDYLKKGDVAYEDKTRISLQLVEGLAYLHSQRVLHADIKPGNVLIDRHGDAKWSDFGLSKTKTASVATIAKSSHALAWQAPEAYQRRARLTEASDIYSVGSVLSYLWTGKAPYAHCKDDAEIARVIASGCRERVSEAIPGYYADWIRRCWQESPRDRPSASDLTAAFREAPRPPSPSGEEYYRTGLTAERTGDFYTAAKHYQNAARKGQVRALTQLGLFALIGKGDTPLDKQKALDLFERAARATPPHPRAMLNLAEMLCYGDGVKQDRNRALFWYQEAMRLTPESERDRRTLEKIERLTAELPAVSSAASGCARPA